MTTTPPTEADAAQLRAIFAALLAQTQPDVDTKTNDEDDDA